MVLLRPRVLLHELPQELLMLTVTLCSCRWVHSVHCSPKTWECSMNGSLLACSCTTLNPHSTTFQYCFQYGKKLLQGFPLTLVPMSSHGIFWGGRPVRLLQFWEHLYRQCWTWEQESLQPQNPPQRSASSTICLPSLLKPSLIIDKDQITAPAKSIIHNAHKSICQKVFSHLPCLLRLNWTLVHLPPWCSSSGPVWRGGYKNTHADHLWHESDPTSIRPNFRRIVHFWSKTAPVASCAVHYELRKTW